MIFFEVVFRFSLQCFSEKFLIPRKIEQDMMEKVYFLHVKRPLFLSYFNEIRIFSTIFEKYSNIKFRENPSSWIRAVPCGWAGGRTDGGQT